MSGMYTIQLGQITQLGRFASDHAAGELLYPGIRDGLLVLVEPEQPIRLVAICPFGVGLMELPREAASAAADAASGCIPYEHLLAPTRVRADGQRSAERIVVHRDHVAIELRPSNKHKLQEAPRTWPLTPLGDVGLVATRIYLDTSSGEPLGTVGASCQHRSALQAALATMRTDRVSMVSSPTRGLWLEDVGRYGVTPEAPTPVLRFHLFSLNGDVE